MSTDLVTRDGLVSARGGIWNYISASRLAKWLMCPLAFKFQYVDGIRPPSTPSLFLGRVVHAALETYYRHRQVGVTLEPEVLASRIQETWNPMAEAESVRFADAAAEQALQRQAVDLVAAYVRQVPTDEPRPLAVEAAAEAPLVDPTTGENFGIPLVGVMDLVLDGQGGPVVVDFKTTARSSEPLEVVHELQLSCYAWLFRQVEGRPEGGLEIRSLVKTKTPKVDAHRYAARDERHFGRLFAVLRAYLDDLDAGRFVVRPGLHCGMCDFCEDRCRQWGG